MGFDIKPNEIRIIIDQELIDEYADLYFKVHRRAKKKPIPYPYHPSLNSWTHLSNEAMNAEKQKWNIFIDWVLDKYELKNRMIQKCIIEYITFFKTNTRHDSDNTCPKFINDALVNSGFIVDDDYKHLKRCELECNVDKTHPRTEIIVHILEG